MTSTGALFPVAPGSIPKFTVFDATVELWKDYLAWFITFVGANSISVEKTAQVFLTSQSTTTYKLLGTVAGQQDPPKDINEFSMEDINAFMEQQDDPKCFVVWERFRFWSNMAAQTRRNSARACSKDTPRSCNLRFRFIKGSAGRSTAYQVIRFIGNEAVLKALFQIKDD